MIPDEKEVSFCSIQDLSKSAAPVVDVRTDEAYREAHIPNAVNSCVYETAFVENIKAAYPDLESPLILAGQGGTFKADQVAWLRLTEAGYTSVVVLEGGVDAYGKVGFDLETLPVTHPSPEGAYTLDPGGTRVHWVGRNLMNQHFGTVDASTGELVVNAEGVPLHGNVEVDMTRIHCEDLEDPGMAQMLIGHLSSVDFFDVAKFPKASFSFLHVEELGETCPGSPNLRIQGELEARGRNIPLEIEALVAQTESGMVFKTVVEFDRTLVGAVYGSGRLFERLGMHLVQDLVSLDVRALFIRK